MDSDTQSKFIPNSFQMVNAYVDHAMQYLTGDEFKVLIFTVRHIMGWQERIATRRAHISLSTYANGYAGMGGVGLSREKIVSALRELEAYKFLKRVKAKDGTYHKGTLWELCFNPDLIALEQRAAAKLDTNRKRIAKARKARASAIGLTDKTSLDTQTDIGLDTQTDIGLTDKTESNPLSKTTFKFAPAKADAMQSPVNDAKDDKPKRQRKRDTLFDAISLHLYGIPEGQAITDGSRIGKTKKVFTAHNVTAEEVPLFWAWMRRTHPKIEELKDPPKVEEYLIKWMAQRKAKASQSGGGQYLREYGGGDV